jgi:hypothetical protein
LRGTDVVRHSGFNPVLSRSIPFILILSLQGWT